MWTGASPALALPMRFRFVAWQGKADTRFESLEAGKVDRPEMSAVADALRAMRATLVAGGGALTGARAELLESVQASQQHNATQILSLQTHVRTLLRKAEQDREVAPPSVDAEMLAALKAEVSVAHVELG